MPGGRRTNGSARPESTRAETEHTLQWVLFSLLKARSSPCMACCIGKECWGHTLS